MTAIERMVNGDKNAVWEVIEENSKLIHSALKSWHFKDGTNEYEPDTGIWKDCGSVYMLPVIV